MNKTLLNLSLSLLTLGGLSAQNVPKECKATQEIDNYFKLNPQAKSNYLQAEINRKKISKNFSKNAEGSYVIPVVFHVYGTDYNNGTTVDNDVIQLALEQTNLDFQGLAEDYNTIDAPWDTIKQTLDISFKLAQIDPNGNLTTGINYYPVNSGFGNGGGYDQEIQQYAWDNEKYMNVYIMNDLYADGDTYNSGVAWYPSQDMTNNNTARVVYNGSYLSTMNTSENFRSVFTHEFGHWLNLAHTFNGGCTYPNDNVADTPPLASNSSGTNCEVITNCEGDEINNENFMDYTDCYKMFTQGQVTRMVNALEDNSSTARFPLWQNQNLIDTGLSSDLGARIVPSSSAFIEKYENDGSIDNSINFDCMDCTFTKSNGDLIANTDYTISNVPAGLTARVSLTSNTNGKITVSGNATDHELLNSIDNLKIVFNNNILSEDISTLYADNITMAVNFIDEYTEYCTPSISYAIYSHITNVNFNSSENITGYTDVTDYSNILKHNARAGQTYELAITTNKGNGGDNDLTRIQTWFDFNNNFIYEENELLISHTYNNTDADADGNYTFNTSITIPNNVTVGETAFRVMAHYVQGSDGDTPCGKIDSGEVEDYGLNILEANATFKIDFNADKTEVNMSELVNLFDATVTDLGDSITSWAWTFEGASPATSNVKNPTNILFTEEGIYDVSLTVTTANGTSQTIIKEDYITSKLEYCDSSPNFGGYFSVNSVEFNTINNEPYLSTSHSFYDTISTEVTLGQTYPITIGTEKGSGGSSDVNRVRVWIDWNYNSAFDANELMISREVNYTDYDADGNFTFTENITAPLDAKSGKKAAMRVIGHYVDGSSGEHPCGDIDSGNVADYGINILNGENGVVADFTSSRLSIPIYESINLSNISSVSGGTITSYEWTFENANIETYSQENTPEITFTTPGEHNVTLTVVDSNGNTDSKTLTITVTYNTCDTTANWGTQYAHITNFTYGDINNVTSQNGVVSNNYFNDFNTNVNPNESTEMSVTVNKGASGDADKIMLKVWVDWNYNGILESDELVKSTKLYAVSDFDANGESVQTFNVDIPSDASNNKLIIKAIAHYYTGNNEGACDTLDSGESELYGVTVTGDLSIENHNLLNSVIYPNPAKDYFYLKTNNNQALKVEIFNILGQKVSSKNTQSNFNYHSVSHLNSGLYIVKIIQNNKISTHKLIIK